VFTKRAAIFRPASPVLSHICYNFAVKLKVQHFLQSLCIVGSQRRREPFLLRSFNVRDRSWLVLLFPKPIRQIKLNSIYAESLRYIHCLPHDSNGLCYVSMRSSMTYTSTLNVSQAKIGLITLPLHIGIYYGVSRCIFLHDWLPTYYTFLLNAHIRRPYFLSLQCVA
jgi:hypothetical protein